MLKSHQVLSLFVLALLFSHQCLAQNARVDVTIIGVDKPLLENVKKSLSINTNKSNNSRIQALHAQAVDEIKQALQPFGYYHPKIKSRLEKKNDSWLAKYTIDKGRATLINSLSISVKGSASKEPFIQDFIAAAPLVKGNKIDHALYETTKKQLINLAFERGYLDVVYELSELQINLEKFSADINLVLSTGKQYFFGDVNIEQDILDKNYVNRYVKIQSGDPYRSQSLLNLQIDLLNTNYFRSLDIRNNKSDAVDNVIPITIQAEPALRRRYSGRVGYGTDTGYRVGLGYIDNRVTKTGHQFLSDIQISEVESQISARYKIPIGNPAVEFTDFILKAKKETVNQTDSVQYVIGSSYNIERYNGLLRSFFTIEQEEFTFGNGPTSISNLFIPGVSYFKRQTKNTLFSRDGYSLFAQIKAGVNTTGDDTQFLQGQLSIKNVTSITEQSRLLFRFDYGKSFSDHFSRLPPSQRFYTGGARTVRGFAYQSIAPKNTNGITIGGNTLATSSVEFDYLIRGNLGFATFYDAGDVTQDDEFDFKQSLGLGLRYRSPIGMIRIDFAKPIDTKTRRNNQDSLRLHLSMGPDL